MSQLEVELKRFMQDSQLQTKQQTDGEKQRIAASYEERVRRLAEELASKDALLDKVRAQNSDVTRELLEATNEAGAC
jgi:predicted  nucleic acid-binding Zn-ribbon protein